MSRRLAVLVSVVAVLLVAGGIEAYCLNASPTQAWQAVKTYLNSPPGALDVAQSVPSLPAVPPRDVPDNPLRTAATTEYVVHPFDWPQWLGPQRTGVSSESGLLRDWPKDGPRLVWEVDFLGSGLSTPTVAGGRVFVMGNRAGTEYVLALSEIDGGLVWDPYAIGPVRANGGGYPGPRCSPAVDGNRVYALGLSGDLVCLDVTNGHEIWRKDLGKDFNGVRGEYGYSESPLIDGDKLLCTPGGKSATMVALNKHTGSVVWQCPVPGGDRAEYSSMIAADVAGRREYIQFLFGGVVGVSDNGRFLWRYVRPANSLANCSTPLYHDGAVFAASSYGTGGGLAKLETNGDAVTAREVYFTRRMKSHHGGMVLLDGYIYGADDSLLTCLDWKTGDVQWNERKPGKGSITAADGRLYYRNEDGPMVLIEVNPKKYIEHGRFQPPQRSDLKAWPHPVIANGKLYLRDQEFLLCYDVKAQ
jgi:outer membrane protein assembly factor BamB